MQYAERPHERWIWTELIGFDNTQPDMGVGEYLDTAGFTPTGICLMLTSPDFVLSHESVDGEITLPEDFCSRDGHEFNPHRARQEWTNRQLQGLIDQLHQHGIRAFVSVFTRFYGNRFHHEWLSDHPEACLVFRHHGWASSMNCLSRLSDGSYMEDYFIRKLVETMEYYGFDGWHGADGWGPLNGPIYEVPVSDDMVAQFAEFSGMQLPPVAAGPCEHDIEKLEARMQWIWQHARHEWIEFFAQRWAGFWQKALEAIHASGKQAFINSSWGRAPWESLYRYGIDYKRIAEAGVDGIIVETVAAGLAMDPRPNTSHESRHFDFLSMLMLIDAYVPDTKLIFLHNTHDTVEEWDAIRHLPMVLEKEIYSLNNILRTGSDGKLQPCADGFLVCLGDGLDPEHWSWLRSKWNLALSGSPVRALGATLVWSDALMKAQVEDFTATRNCTLHPMLFHLMTRGATVQTSANIGDLDSVTGAILVLNHHLLPEGEFEKVLGYQGGPIILVGRERPGLPYTNFTVTDSCGADPLVCIVYGAPGMQAPEIEPCDMAPLAGNLAALEEPKGYWDHFAFQPVSPGFVDACAQAISTVSGGCRIVDGAGAATLMATEETSGKIRVALKNKTDFYARPRVDVGRKIAKVEILTDYPSLRVRPEGSEFSIRVPGKGYTLVEVTLEPEE